MELGKKFSLPLSSIISTMVVNRLHCFCREPFAWMFGLCQRIEEPSKQKNGFQCILTSRSPLNVPFHGTFKELRAPQSALRHVCVMLDYTLCNVFSNSLYCSQRQCYTPLCSMVWSGAKVVQHAGVTRLMEAICYGKLLCFTLLVVEPPRKRIY